MTGVRKSGKGRSKADAGKRAPAGARPEKPGKQASSAAGAGRGAKDHWRELIESSAAWIWETDADIRHTYTNAFVTRCLGYEPAEFLGLDTLDLVHPDDRGLLKRLVQNAVTRKEGWLDQVLRWRHKDGSWRHIESSGTALFDEQGAFTGLCGVDHDVTGQQRAADNLRRSEEKYRNLFENAIDAICITDREQNYLDVNRRAVELFGYSREELLAMNVRDLLPPGQIARSEKEFTKLTESGAYEMFTGQARRKDGRCIDIEVSSSAIVEQGQVIGSRDIIRDITRRTRTEEALRENETRYRTLFEALDAAVLLMRGPVCVECNPFTLKLFGLSSRDEIIGKTPLDFAPEHQPDGRRSAEMIQENVEMALAKGLHVFEWQAFRKTGEPVLMEVRFTPYRIGEEQYFQCIAIDITERKRAEEALRSSEDRYRQLFDAESDAIVLVDNETGRILMANNAASSLYGYSMEELLAKKNTDLSAEPSETRRVTEETPVIKDNAVTIPLRYHRKKDGTVFPVEITGRFFQHEGRPVHIAAIRDITERKKAEEELAGQKAMLQQILDTSSVAIFLVDKTGRITRANSRMAEMFGRTMEELDGIEYVELVHPSEQETGRKKMLALLANEIPSVDLERRYRRKDGTEFWGHLSGRRFSDIHGAELGLIGVISDITERKLAEAESREKESKYRTLFEAANDGIFIHDSTGFTDCNQRGAEMYGLPKEKLIGRSPVEFAPERQPDGRLSAEVAGEKVQAALAGAPQVFEWQPLRADGTPFDVEITLSRTELGGKVYLQAIVRDITERKRVQEALRKSERMLQTIIDAEPECVKLLDENACLIMMNRAGLDMLQVDNLDAVKGQCVCPMVTSAYRPAFLGLTKRVFQGESGTLLFEMVGMKGRRLWLETHAVPLRNDKDVIIALLGVTRDVTEWKRTEEALRRSEGRFRAIIEHASSGILVADIETGKFRYANPQICRMLGYGADELMALEVASIHPQSELPIARRAFAERQGVLTRCVRKDGTEFPVEIRSVELELDGRQCLVGFFTDITEKLLLEEERLKAQKLESIGTLAGGIAHDFNNLLQGVFGYISMAKLTADRPEKSLAMLTQAEKALHQSVNLTSQLLTFSKGGKPVRKTVDLRPVIENAVKFALSGSRVNYDLAMDKDLSMVEADAGQIGQVVQNIVLNAEQAMPLGGTIGIAARNAPASGAAGHSLPAPDGLVEIAVRDQGIGIPPEHLPRIFDPYFTTKEKGSGLGLATSYSIVKNHDGTIDVSSELGKGTTFTVYLPATRSVPGPDASSGPGTCAAGRKCRVLVMDDEPLVRVVAAELLRELGHEADFAEHGDAAIEKYKEAKAGGRPFNVVILDLTIRGGKGGAETVQELLTIDPGVKAVVSSGYSDDEIIATYRQHGFRAFLKKPYDMTDLARVLDELMA